MSNTKKTIAVDFDGTLADDSRVKYPECGPPVWRMVERVRRWIAEGHEVVLFTARLAEKDVHRERNQVKRLTEWLDLYGIHNTDGTVIAMTAWKLPKFDEFWDDNAVRVARNLGVTETVISGETAGVGLEGPNYDAAFGFWGQPKSDNDTGRYLTPETSQLELNFGGGEHGEFPGTGIWTKHLYDFSAPDPREPYTR